MAGKKITPKKLEFVAAYVECQNASEAFRKTFNVKGWLPQTVGTRALELLSEPEIISEISKFTERNLEAGKVSRVEAIRLVREIATADASMLSQVQVRNCRHCWGLGHRYQWSSEIEYAFRCAEITDADAASQRAWERDVELGSKRPRPDPTPLPSDAGGYGFKIDGRPNGECPACLGDGITEVRFADTRTLTGPAKRLFAGVKKTKDGFEIKQRDQDMALKLLAQISGAIGPETGPPPVNVNVANTGSGTTQVAVVLPNDAVEASRMYQSLMQGKGDV
jgi:phage terminase small subunit